MSSPAFQIMDSPIFLGTLSEHLPTWLASRAYHQVFILTDQRTHEYCLPLLQSVLPPMEAVYVYCIAAGESEKNLQTCAEIWQAMLEAKLDRNALVLNLGGGVIGDMGGFCAATWKRGVDFVQIPTTLLAMTDAALGGKTGVDFQGIKNIIGVFKPPAAVFIDPHFLQTLAIRERHSGLAEVIKHAVIGEPFFYQWLLGAYPTRHTEAAFWLEMLEKSVAVKVRVVTEDPLEKGPRMLLNFGHSIGHALESWFLSTPQPLTHGEAIFIGMLCEAWVSQNERLAERVYALGKNLFPWVEIPPSAFTALWEAMQQDKKNASGTVRMAVPDESAYTLRLIHPTKSDIKAALARYQAMEI